MIELKKIKNKIIISACIILFLVGVFNIFINTIEATNNDSVKLKQISVGIEGLTPNFNPNTTNYAITVNSNISKLNIIVEPEKNITYTIEGNENFKLGNNKIVITAKSLDGIEKKYNIIVTKAKDITKANAFLETIMVQDCELNPEFTSENLEYDLGKTVNGTLEIFASPKSGNAKVEITGNTSLIEGKNVIKIKVTAEDKVTTKEYILSLIKVNSLDKKEIEQKITEKEKAQSQLFKDSNAPNNDNNIMSKIKNCISYLKQNYKGVILIFLTLFVIILTIRLKTKKFKK